jgi:excisionase family DNA binding protein
MNATGYLTTIEAAELLGVSERRVRKFCEEGRLGQRIGRIWAIAEVQVAQFAQIERLSGGAGHKEVRKKK